MHSDATLLNGVAVPFFTLVLVPLCLAQLTINATNTTDASNSSSTNTTGLDNDSAALIDHQSTGTSRVSSLDEAQQLGLIIGTTLSCILVALPPTLAVILLFVKPPKIHENKVTPRSATLNLNGSTHLAHHRADSLSSAALLHEAAQFDNEAHHHLHRRPPGYEELERHPTLTTVHAQPQPPPPVSSPALRPATAPAVVTTTATPAPKTGALWKRAAQTAVMNSMAMRNASTTKMSSSGGGAMAIRVMPTAHTSTSPSTSTRLSPSIVPWSQENGAWGGLDDADPRISPADQELQQEATISELISINSIEQVAAGFEGAASPDPNPPNIHTPATPDGEGLGAAEHTTPPIPTTTTTTSVSGAPPSNPSTASPSKPVSRAGSSTIREGSKVVENLPGSALPNVMEGAGGDGEGGRGGVEARQHSLNPRPTSFAKRVGGSGAGSGDEGKSQRIGNMWSSNGAGNDASLPNSPSSLDDTALANASSRTSSMHRAGPSMPSAASRKRSQSGHLLGDSEVSPS